MTTLRRAALAAVCLVALPACWGGDDADDHDGDSTSADGPAPTVAAHDSVVNEIPQRVSLVAEMVDGVLTIRNDGNVTMSAVAVADGAGASVCDIGTLAPQAESTCPAATAGNWHVTGSGPQGQPAEVTP